MEAGEGSTPAGALTDYDDWSALTSSVNSASFKSDTAQKDMASRNQ